MSDLQKTIEEQRAEIERLRSELAARDALASAPSPSPPAWLERVYRIVENHLENFIGNPWENFRHHCRRLGCKVKEETDA